MKLIKRKKIVNPDYKVNRLYLLVSSFLGLGFSPYASGTVASFATMVLIFIFHLNDIFFLALITIVCIVVGIIVSGDAIGKYGKDPSVVVIDEVAGMLVAYLVSLILSPAGSDNIQCLIGAFIGFRFFDVVKIFPSTYFDKINNSCGIMMDDVIAGFYGGVLSAVFNLSFKLLGVSLW
ncbi:MAG: phosphatidylglycerophosphatase A family protein [Ignavibacteria bacterium]